MSSAISRAIVAAMKCIAMVLAVVACGGGAKQAPTDNKPNSAITGAPDPTNPAAGVLDTPELLAKEFLAALASGDPARVRAHYMTPDDIGALVTCAKDPVIELREHLVELEGKLKPTTSKIEFEAWVENGRSVLKAGTLRDGCTAKRDFELATGTIKSMVVSDNGTQPDAKLVAIVKVGAGWRVWKLSKY